MSNRILSCSLMVATIAAFANSAHADVVFDGTMGSPGTLSGNFDIPDSAGTQVGSNLFHSFTTFNINTGESATFTSGFAGVTDNVISRVTGGSISTIDGLLASTIPGAAVWLINPRGVVFGDNATLSVPGSFHISTADYLLFEDGGRFDATNLGGTVLTMSNPLTFGFLGPNPAPIDVGAATLQVANGETISLVGGDINLTGSTISAPEGRINMVGIGEAGEVDLTNPDANRANLTSLGDISLHSSTINVDGQGGGDIYILGGQFFGGASLISSNTIGDSDGGEVRIDVDELTLTDGTGIDTNIFGAGNASSVSVDATGTVAIVPGGASGFGGRIWSIAQAGSTGDAGSISVSASDFDMQFSSLVIFQVGNGQAGDLTLDIQNSLNVMGNFGSALANNSIDDANAGSVIVNAGDINFFGGSILVRAFGDGDAGQISVTADNLTMANGTQFVAGAFGFGSGGVVNVDVVDTITMSDDIGFPTGIFSGSANGVGGDINVHSRILNLLEGAEFSNSAFGTASTGGINVTVDESIFISGRPDVFTGIFSNTFAGGDAGSINISTPVLELANGGSIQASALDGSTGRGGTIFIDVDDLLMGGGNSFISARTFSSGDGGDIVISADAINMAGTPGTFDGIFAGTDSTGNGGSILINTGSLDLFDSAFIQASTFGAGNAGSIAINALDSIRLDAQVDPSSGIFNSTLADGHAGSISIDANDLTVTGLATIQAATGGTGNGGAIDISANNIVLTDGGSISALTLDSGNAGTIDIDVSSTFSASGGDQNPAVSANVSSASFGSGNGGAVRIAADNIMIDDNGIISASTTSDGGGGDLIIEGRVIAVSDGSTVSASASGAGNAGTIMIIAVDDLIVTDASIETSSTVSAGGNIDLQVGQSVFLNNGGTISAAAGGVTATDGGGNISIDRPVFVVLREGSILATANAGNGGNIDITANSFIVDLNSVIDASSQTGLDGRIRVEAVNNIYGSVLLLEAPSIEAPDVLTQRCVAAVFRDRSSLTVEQQDQQVWSPEDFVPSPLSNETLGTTAVSSALQECGFTLVPGSSVDAS